MHRARYGGGVQGFRAFSGVGVPPSQYLDMFSNLETHHLGVLWRFQ